MPARSYLTIPYASTFTLDADLSKNFQVTLAGSPTITLSGGRDGEEITVALTQGGSGSYNPTWANVTWQAGYKPNLNSAVGGLDTLTLVKQGSTWTDKGGAPSKLPSRVAVASVATVISLILGSSGTALFTSKLSVGSGAPSDIGKVADNRQVLVGSGSNATMTIRELGSGGLLITSSGGNLNGIGIGVPNLKSTSKIGDANLFVNGEGELTGSSSMVRGTISGKTLVVGGVATAGVGQAICLKTGRIIGYCSTTPTNGTCTCN